MRNWSQSLSKPSDDVVRLERREDDVNKPQETEKDAGGQFGDVRSSQLASAQCFDITTRHQREDA